ncbi:MAG: septal ring lytic transglycosylase RlpA family protein [Burkholderiales bacterium]
MPRLALTRQCAAFAACALLVAACGTAPSRKPTPSAPAAAPPAPTASAKYYKDDGPGEAPPPNLDQVPDATPRAEPLHRFANNPYTVLGKDYVPATSLRPYRERGIASWYGRKFHGQKTSIGETYDMYAMTAAHPTLPLPSYARVTNVATGKSIVVRVNDRGPFLHGRVIDLSYAAAYKVGIAAKGSGEVEVEAIIPGDGPVLAAAPPLPPVVAAAPPPATTAAAKPPEPPPAPITRDAAGFVVQLGAFRNFNNAQTFLAHVQAQLADAQVEPKVRDVGGLYRVYVGPYPDRDEAKRVGDRITAAFGVATAVAPH